MSQHTIPIPSNFPVNWEDPTDDQLFWAQQGTKFPYPMPPLGFDLMAKFTFCDGMNAAFIEYQVPINFRPCCFNGYFYTTIVPNPHCTPDSSAEGEAKLQQAIKELPERLNMSLNPEILLHLAYWEDYDVNNATLPELLTYLDEIIERIRRMWGHFLLDFPSMVVLSQFEEMCDDVFRDNARIAPYQLLTDSEPYTITSSSNRELWQLSHHALNEPAVHQILLQTPAAEVMTALEGSTVGQPFLEKFKKYLERYGRQVKAMFYIHHPNPNWREDPTPIIDILKTYLAQPDKDLSAACQHAYTQREKAITTVHSHLNMSPQPVIQQFESLLTIAPVAALFLKEHTYWLEVLTCHVRQIALAIGQRFQEAGAMTRPDDIFYLTYKELKTLVATSPLPPQDTLVNGRRATLMQFANVTPPATLGTVPTCPPPSHPVVHAVLKELGAPQSFSSEGNL